MTSRYLDPMGGKDTNDGASGTQDSTSVGPWLSLAWATSPSNANRLVNGDSLLIKGDSDWSISGEFKGLSLSSKSNITVATYGSGATPRCQYNRDMPDVLMTPAEIAGTPLTVMNKWYEVDPADGMTPQSGTSLWRINIAPYYQGFVYVTFGVENFIGFRGPYWFKLTDLSPVYINSRYAPRNPGDWDAREGVDANDPAAFLCFARDSRGPVHYYGRIRWQSYQEPIILAYDSTGVVIDGLQCVNSGLLARFAHPGTTGDGHIIRNCISTDSGMLVGMLGGTRNSGVWAQNFKIQQNRIIRSQAIPINPSENIQDGIIEANYMEDCGLIKSDGGIYLGNCWAPSGHEIHIRRNVGLRQRYGNYWLWDGRVIMTDSDSANVWAYGNVAKDCHQAYGSNSGVVGCRWWGNLAIGCDHGYEESDLLNFSMSGSGRTASDTIVANNTFVGCGIRKWYVNDGRTPESERQVLLANDGALVLASLDAATAASWRVYNNVITGMGDYASQCFAMTIQPSTVGHYSFLHNASAGFKNTLGLYGVSQTPDASNVTGDLKLDGWVPKAESPLLGAGLDWWTADGKTTLGPAPGVSPPLHIGAFLPW